MSTRYQIEEMLALGHSEAHVSRTLNVPLPEVHRAHSASPCAAGSAEQGGERRCDGTRMRTEWEPSMRPRTKMLQPEMRNGG